MCEGARDNSAAIGVRMGTTMRRVEKIRETLVAAKCLCLRNRLQSNDRLIIIALRCPGESLDLTKKPIYEICSR